MNPLFKYIILCCLPYFLNGYAAAATPVAGPIYAHECNGDKARYQQQQAKFHQFVDSVKHLSGTKQVIALDKYLQDNDDLDWCYSYELWDYESQLLADLVQLDANGIFIKPERTFHCFELNKRHQCNPNEEEYPIGEKWKPADAIPVSIKTLRLHSTLEDAPLVGIYNAATSKPIDIKDGKFKRPAEGTYIFAIYTIQSKSKFLKFAWTVHGK